MYGFAAAGGGATHPLTVTWEKDNEHAVGSEG